MSYKKECQETYFPKGMSYKKECQETYFPLGRVPILFSSRHSAQLFERALSRSESGLPQAECPVSSSRAKPEIRFLFPVVPFRCRERRQSFSETTSLMVVHWMSGNAWSYLRLVAYGFIRLSEEA
jgi:hypothetical protein